MQGERSTPALLVRLIGPTGDELDSFRVIEGEADYDRLSETADRARLVARGVQSDVERVEEKLRRLVGA